MNRKKKTIVRHRTNIESLVEAFKIRYKWDLMNNTIIKNNE